MPKVLAPGQPYSGRAPGVVPVNVSIDREAYEVLKRHVPTPKAHGRFLSRLLYEFGERQRILGKVAGVLDAETTVIIE